MKINTKIEQQKITHYQILVNNDAPAIPAGLSRTHRIINAMMAKENQFLLLCAQIRLNENKKERAENQRRVRKAKR